MEVWILNWYKDSLHNLFFSLCRENDDYISQINLKIIDLDAAEAKVSSTCPYVIEA